MEKQVHRPQTRDDLLHLSPNITRPVWNTQQMSCQSCKYNGQDVDTFPCAKCHTRN